MSNLISYFKQTGSNRRMLTSLSKYDHTALSIPYPSEDIHPLFSKFSKTKADIKISIEKILEIQLKSLAQLYDERFQYKTICSTSAWDAITNQMQWLSKEREIVNYSDDRKVHLISSRLQKMYKNLNSSEIIAVSCAHRDFTPWNLNADVNRLYRYEWETSDCGIPMLMDLFHHLFLSGTLLFKKDFKEITKNINNTLENTIAKTVIKQYKINVKLHYQLYLLFSISYYLRSYINQKFPHVQVHRLMDAWNEALLEFE